MVIFLLGEDRSYLSWITHHRNGFVLDWLRKPTNKKPIIHRALCPEIKTAKSKNTHWTTGRHIKVCSLDVDELESWAREEVGDRIEYCPSCKPREESFAPLLSDRHLTKLGKEIVDYVVEAAVIHLDRPNTPYDATVADIALGLDKTPKRIEGALHRLAQDDYLRFDPPPKSDGSFTDDCRVYPTADAMRTLPAYQKMPDRKVEAELEGLAEEE